MPSIIEWLALDKVYKGYRIIRHNGGVFGSLFKIFRMDTLRIGTLVGTDKYGNKYYENNEYFHGRNRWVEYADHVYLDYNASQVPAEWHGWLHYSTDYPPTVKPPVKYKWMIDHTENFTGTNKDYVPYTTTREKIASWTPPKDTNKRLPQTK